MVVHGVLSIVVLEKNIFILITSVDLDLIFTCYFIFQKETFIHKNNCDFMCVYFMSSLACRLDLIFTYYFIF